MKFNCGPTREERLAKKKSIAIKHKLEDEQWHKWFAWYPVKIGKNDCRWMTTVERIFIGAEVYSTCELPLSLFTYKKTSYVVAYDEVNYRGMRDEK